MSRDSIRDKMNWPQCFAHNCERPSIVKKLCPTCGKDYCICDLHWSMDVEIRSINRKLDKIIAILDRRKNGRIR